MDDYYEFWCSHEMQIKKWWLYQSPNYASIAQGTMTPNAPTTIASNSYLIKGGNVGFSIKGHCLLLIMLWSPFALCEETTKG